LNIHTLSFCDKYTSNKSDIQAKTEYHQTK
jgi:hypothetical protein